MSRRRCRQGLTLYEIVLALSIMVIAMAVLSDLIATGSRAGSQAKLRTEAMLHAQTKMAEVIAGVEPLSAVRNSVIDTTDGGYDEASEHTALMRASRTRGWTADASR